MSKVLLGIGIGVCLWTAGICVTFLTGGHYDNDAIPVNQSSGLIKEEDITTKYQELPCVSNLFRKMNIRRQGPSIVFHGFKQNEKMNGCLSVWWDKETYKNYWRGNWNLLWGMRNESIGIIVLSSAHADNGKVTISTSSHFLKKEKNEWSGWAVQRTKADADVNKNRDIKTSAILPGEALIEPREGWDFSFDSKNVCSNKNRCVSASPLQETASLNWNFVKGTIPKKQKSIPIYKWSSNIDKLVKFGSNSISHYFSKVNGYLDPA